MNRALLTMTDPIILHLAPQGSLLLNCLVASKWDHKNKNSTSLAHYNQRLAVSKLLQAITENAEAENLIRLLTSTSKSLTKKDVIKGFKSAEVILKGSQPIRIARTYSLAFRNFIKTYSGVLCDASKVSEIIYTSILLTDSKYLTNNDVSLFEIKIKDMHKDTNFVDPDFFPTLFKKNSVLHHMLQNMETKTTESPLPNTTFASLKAQLHFIDDLPNSALIKEFLNSSLDIVTFESIITSLHDYERRIFTLYSHKKLNQMSIIFRQYLFTYSLDNPELIAAKNKFITNFDKCGNLKFRPNYNIRTKDGNYEIDSFLLSSVLPTQSVAEICFERLEKTTKDQPAKSSDVTNLLKVLMVIQQNHHANARLLFAKKPKELSRYHVVKGLKEIDEIITSSFPEQEIETLTLVKNFLNLCNAVTKNGMLISEIEVESLITPKFQPQILPVNAYSKTNGKTKSLFYKFNVTKISDLLTPNGTLAVALNNLKHASSTTIPPSSTLSTIELTLSYIIEAEKNDAIKRVLTNPLANLNQRDFRLGFAQLEDIIDTRDINSKAAKSQVIRTFLNKYAGKINGQIAIKNCGFSSRFSAVNERNTQKLIEPVNENGEILLNPILDKHVSLNEIKVKIRDYLTKPIEQIIEACKSEINNYNKLLSCITNYLAVDEAGNYVYKIPEEVSNIVIENQLDEGNKLKRTKVVQIRELYTNQVLLGAYVRHQIYSGLTSTTRCLDKAMLVPQYVAHWFPTTRTGMKDLFWSSVFLPKYILLVCFIRLTIRTTWNKDVIATLKRSDLPTSLSDMAFTISGFKEKVNKHTTPVTIEPHEKEVREAISLLIQHHDNMISYSLKPESLWDTPDSTKLSFLSDSLIDNFREHYTLSYFRMELLAKHQINLRKGIDGDLIKSQLERNHGSMRVTAGYLSHPIAQLEHEANNADFQRRFETTVQFRDNKESLEKYGFDVKNIDTDLLIAPHKNNDPLPEWFLLPDGSSCVDIFAPVDRSRKDSVCRGRVCHKADGCKFNRVEIGEEEFVYTLRHQAYYLSRGMALLDKHGQEYFDEFIAPNMRFTFGLVKYVEFANPRLFRQAQARVSNVQ